MAVRKREWKNREGETQSAWVAEYFDHSGKRRLKTFEKKKDADFSRKGRSPRRLAYSRRRDNNYRKGWRALAGKSQLSAPVVRQFEDDLLSGNPPPSANEGTPGSTAMVKKVRAALSMMIGDALERGLVNRNVVRELRSRRKAGNERKADRRQKGKLKIGVDIPTADEIRRIIQALEDHAASTADSNYNSHFYRPARE